VPYHTVKVDIVRRSDGKEPGCRDTKLSR
jgi:hypothetical protein